MATREETQRRREALRAHLLEAGRFAGASGRATEGVRGLANRFQLSVTSVLEVQRLLRESGALDVKPGVGTFARPHHASARREALLLMVHGPVSDEARGLLDVTMQTCRDFSNAASALGASALALEWNVAHEMLGRGELPLPSGVFDMSPRSDAVADETRWSELEIWATVPRVSFSSHVKASSDTLSFDDEAGGELATRHLLEAGFKRVAFLGLDDGSPLELLEWSRGRETGYRRAMRDAGLSVRGLVVHPSPNGEVPPSAGAHQDEAHALEAGRLMARLVSGRDIEAVVAVNDAVAGGLLQGLAALEVAMEKWPAIVGFDADPRYSGRFLTSLCLSSDELCRCAAEMLWARANGTLQGAGQHRKVPMKLISRLSCQTKWFHPALGSGLLQRALAPTS